MPMTHRELVARAARWLANTIGCGVVLTEHTGGREFPDAIGWKGAFSYVVECKVSRSDYTADLRKPSRAAYELRPAFNCYYLTPPRLLLSSALPDLPRGWGLLHAHPRHVAVVQQAKPEDTDDRQGDQLREEIYRMYCELRRYQVQGLKPLTYAAFRRQIREAGGVVPR